MPPKDRERIVEELCLKYSPWFFEILAELDGQRLRLEDFQVKYLLDDSSYTIQNKTRQGGGSLVLALKKFFKAYRTENYRCDIVSINQKEATDKIKYIRNIHDSLPTYPRNWKIPLTVDNALSIGFHTGRKKSVIYSVAASVGVRGGRKDVVFDEFAHIDKAEELYIAAAPAMIRGEMTMDIVSTPMGNRGLFSDIWHNRPNSLGKKPYDAFSRHQFAWWDVTHFVKDLDKEEARRVWKEEYREDIANMGEFVNRFASDRLLPFLDIFPWDMFLQEFCCVFVDETTAFYPWELINSVCREEPAAGVAPGDFEEITMEKWKKRPEDNVSDVYMGVDFAAGREGGDSTAVQVLERLSSGEYLQRYSFTMTGSEWSNFDKQYNEIVRIVQDFRPARISMDQTSLGIAMTYELQKRLPTFHIEPVTFTNQNKAEMAMNLKTMMEKQKIFIQTSDKQLQGQIHNIQRDVLPSNLIRYHGEPHDDMFWALALAAKGGSYSPWMLFQIG